MKLSLITVTILVIFINSEAQIATFEEDNPGEIEDDYNDQINSVNTEEGNENSTTWSILAEEANLKSNESLGERDAGTLQHSLPKKDETETKKPTVRDPNECGDPPPVKNAIIYQGKEIRYEVNAKVTYACEFGYITDGSVPYSVCRFSDDTQSLQWTETAIRCSPKSCGDPGYVAHAHRVGSVFTFPNKVSFECNDGYMLQGYGTRYCQTSATWSGNLPTCEPIFCDPPANPENGKVSYTSLGYEAELHYECNSGFILKNHQERICSADGTWSASDPICQEAQCDPPVPPKHGAVQIIGDKSSVGNMALYTCDEGRMLVGSATSRCLDIGEWTFPAPKCLDPCFAPKVEHGKMGRYVRLRDFRIRDVRRIFRELPVNSKIEDNEELYLRCEPNYEPLGKPDDEVKVTCSHGEWDATPVCEPAMCRGQPPPTINGNLARANRTHRGYVVYHCRSYAKKTKTGNITCVFGTWKGVTPVCKDLRCYAKELEFPGLVRGRKTAYNTGEVFSVNCEPGYNRTKGNNQLICQDGEWKGQLPPCLSASCNAEDLVESQGVVPGDKKMVLNGDFLDVRCREGYSPSGEQASCSRGHFTVTGKLCQESSCTIHKINRGFLSQKVQGRKGSWLSGYTYFDVYQQLGLSEKNSPGSSVYLYCHEGYTLQGKENRIALVTCSKGKWDPDPVCLLRGTPYKSEVRVSLDTAEKGNIRTSTTREPLVLTPESRPSESDAIPNLNENVGPTPYTPCTCIYQNVDNSLVALVGSEKLSYGSKVKNDDVIRFHCLQFGYARLNGSHEIKCENCRSWHSSEFPICTSPITGDTLLEFEGQFTILPGGIIGIVEGGYLIVRCYSNGLVGSPVWHSYAGEHLQTTSYTDNNRGSVSVLSFSDVSASHHNKEYHCYMPGHRTSAFKIQVIRQTSVNCSKFEERDFVVYYDKGQAVNSTAVFSCKDPRKQIDGINAVTCLSNGQWASGPPKCKTVCPKIAEPEGMGISYKNGLVEGSIAAFHCLLPRIRFGVSRITCMANGEWTNPPAQCILPNCSLHTLYDVVPENVVPIMENVTSQTLPYNYSLSLTCDNNMTITGLNVATCNGTWQVSKVQCVPGCSFPKTERSQMIIDPVKDVYRFGESVSLSCSSGYVLSSDVVRLMCLRTSWSESVLPECVKEQTTETSS